MTYQEALDWIYSFIDWERRKPGHGGASRWDLGRTALLLERLGNPHRQYPTVHIAGTKGKGSVAAMLAQVLRVAGYRTGLYTSPHLHTYRERIRINGQPISKEELTALVEALCPIVQEIPRITTFEVTTALGFWYFAQQAVDIAVVEVGLGGRLDATNLVHPSVTAITSLSLDHTALLGNTLAEIAREKAGIIKPQVPVISAPQAQEAIRVIQAVARQRRAPLEIVGQDWDWEIVEKSLRGQSLLVRGPRQQSYHVRVPLIGRHQAINTTVAVAMLDRLMQSGWRISPEHVVEGLRTVQWPGRLEVLREHPWVVVDGAHNIASVQCLVDALQDYFPYRRMILIYGASFDKDIRGMLDVLAPLSEVIILTRSSHPRAADPHTLAEALPPSTRSALVIEDAGKALDQALSLATSEDLICATGSLFIMAEVRWLWSQRYGYPAIEYDPRLPSRKVA